MSDSVFLKPEEAEELLLAIKGGSSGAFVKLAEAYSPLLESEVSRYEESLGSADLDDIRQGALVSLYRAALSYSFDRGVTFGLYAKICIVNGIADTLHYIGKRNADVSMQLVDEDELPASDMNPQSLMIDKEQYSSLRTRMRSMLSSLENDIFERYLDGYSYAEIAEQTGRSVKSVDNALRRVKDKLKNLF